MPEATDYPPYSPADRCIYCGATDGDLRDEHIVPLSLNGTWILHTASCGPCAKITSAFEGACTRLEGGMLYPFRVRHNMKTRRRGKRVRPIKVPGFSRDGRVSTSDFSAATFPSVVYGIEMPLPGFLAGRPPGTVVERKILFRTPKDDLSNLQSPHYATRIGVFWEGAFFRLLAKIAYSYAAAEMGAHRLDPALAATIRGTAENYLDLIGGDPGGDAIADYDTRLNLVHLDFEGQACSVVFIHLFGKLRMPRYLVVVAREGPVSPSPGEPVSAATPSAG